MKVKDDPYRTGKERLEAALLESRVRKLRAIEYPSITEMRELEAAREAAARINDLDKPEPRE